MQNTGEGGAQTVGAPLPSAPDPVEAALAAALVKAAEQGAIEAMTALAAELKARREARARVVDFEAERARRGKR